MFINVLLEPFYVSTPFGDYAVARRVYMRYPDSLSHRLTLVDLVELDMIDFDAILGMNWFHSLYASIDCKTKVVKF